MSTTPSFYKDELERDQIASLLGTGSLSANEIVEGLWHGQVVVRLNAARGLSVLDPNALPEPGEVMLRIASKDVDARVRSEIVTAVATGLGATPVGVPLLFDALYDRGEGVRDTALQGLERRLLAKPSEVVPWFVNALGDPRALVSSVAGRLLTMAGGTGGAVDHLVPRLGDADARMRRAAYDVLDKLKWQAVDALIQALRDPAARPLVVKLLSGLGQVEPRQTNALFALAANARSTGDALLLEAVQKVQAEITRVVEPPRTAPLDIPLDGFFTRPLEASERTAKAAGRAPLDELLHALRDGRATVRQNAAALLAVHPTSSDASELVLGKLGPTVRDGDAAVRVAAIGTFAALGAGASSAARVLVGALADLHPDVRQAAVEGLVRLGAEALSSAFDAVHTGTPAAAREGLVAVVARIGVGAVPVLADVVAAGAGTSPLARETAANALAGLGKAAEEGIAALVGALGDSIEDVRAAAAEALGFVGVNDEALLQALQRTLKDPVANVRRQAALAASRITGKPLDDRSAAEPRPIPVPGFETTPLDRATLEEHVGALALEDLVRALRDGRELVRRNAATAIGAFGEAGAAAATPLSVLLRDADVEVRRAAAEAFVGLGHGALPACLFLTGALEDGDARVKDTIVDVLVALHPEDGDFLVEALRKDKDVARAGVFLVFDRLGRQGVPDLMRALENSSGLIRLNACLALEALARRGADEASAKLEARLSDPLGDVRVAAQAALDAVQGGKPAPVKVLEPEPIDIAGFDAAPLPDDVLGASRDAVSVERMIRALRDGRPWVRQNAAAVVGHFGADGMPALGAIAVAARDSSQDVRRAAVRALGRLALAAPDGEDRRRAMALVVVALDDRHDGVRAAAREVVKELGVVALPALVESLVRPAEAVKHTLLPAFAALGQAAVPALRAALDADSPLVRAGALRALRVVGRAHVSALRAEIARLDQSSDDAIRAEARATVDHIDGKDEAPAAAPPLPLPPEMTAVELPASVVKRVASGLAFDLLLKATQDGRPVVQANAARALGFVSDPPKRVAGGLAILLRSGETSVRAAAVEALDTLGPRHAAPAAFWLAVALDEPDAAVKERMIEVLAALHAQEPDALIDALRVDPDDAPRTIIPVFDRLGRDAMPTLGRALRSPFGLVRINAAQTAEAVAKKGAEVLLDDLQVVAERDPIKQARLAASLAIDAIQGGKPKPPRVLEIDPVAIAGFDERLLPEATLDDAIAADATTVERMLRALRDGRPFVRTNAARALGAFGTRALDEGALTPLAVAARDSAVDVRAAAVRTLGRLAALGAPPEATALVVAALEDKADVVRGAARAEVTALGAAALPALIDALARPSADKTTLPAFMALAHAAVPALVDALGADSPLVRAGALRALRVVGRDHVAGQRAAVAARASDPDDQVRAEVTATLDHIDGKDVAPPAAPPLPLPDGMVQVVLGEDALADAARDVPVDVLLKALQDGRELVRQNAARALGFVERPPKRVAAALAIALRDAEQAVRQAAVEGLERLGPEAAAPAAFWLSSALAEPDVALRDRVAGVLASLHGTPEGPAALIEALRVDPDIAGATIVPVYARIGGGSIPTLVRALKAPSGLIRINAAMTLEAMARQGADQAWDDLEAALADPIKQVRTQAALAMDAIKGGKPKPPRVLEIDPVGIAGFEDHSLDAAALAAAHDVTTVERLVRALTDGRPWVRENAALTLAAKGADAVPALARLAVLAKDEANNVRKAAVTALGALGEPARTAPILVAALADRTASVRGAARAALGAMGETAFPALALGLATTSEVALDESLVPLLFAFGDNGLAAMIDALDASHPELHVGALRVLMAFSRERLTPHRDAVDKVKDLGDPKARAAAVRLLDKIDGRLDAPSALEPVPLPLPDFADGPRSRDQLMARAEELRLDLLVHALHDGRDVVRENAAGGLGVLQAASEAIAPHLQRALKDPAEPVRFAAAQALAHMQPRRDLAFDLVVALDDASPRVVKVAEEGLARYGEFAIDALMYGLDDAPELVGRAILPMLAAQGARALDPIVLALSYDSALVRQNALVALQLMERGTALAARPAVSLMRHDEARAVRLEVRKTLDHLDDVPLAREVAEPLALPSERFADDSLSLDALAEALAGFDQGLLWRLMIDGRRKVRENAVRAHRVLDVYHPHLCIRLKDDIAEVQHAAAETLEALGMKALPAARALVEALGDGDELIRAPAHRSLAAFGKAALPALIDGLWVRPDIAKKTVVPILVELGEVSTPAIIIALEHPSQLIQLNALQTLTLLYAVDPKGAVKGMERVIAMTRHVLPAIITAAQKCLFRLEGRTPAEFQKDPVPMPIPGFDKGRLPVDVIKPAAPGLDVAWMISALADGRDVVRENAARASGYMPKAVKDLLASIQLALRDAVTDVQVAAAEALATLGVEDGVAIPALTFALRDTSRPGRDPARRAILTALDAFGPKRCVAVLTEHLVGREDWMLLTIGKVAARMHEVFVPALVKVALDPERSLIARENAVRILGDIGPKAKSATPSLIQLLSDMQGMLAAKAAFAIARVSPFDKAVIEAMQKRLQVDPRPSLHHEIIQSVKILKRKQAVGSGAAA